jgi:hypothetical protein
LRLRHDFPSSLKLTPHPTFNLSSATNNQQPTTNHGLLIIDCLPLIRGHDIPHHPTKE